MTTYHVRAADEQDVDAVLALRRHAEDWLREAGIEQWTKSEYGARVIKGWIGAGSTFVASTDDGEVIGSLSLDAGDPDFWTAEERQAPALYLYKFIIRSDHRGSRLGLAGLVLLSHGTSRRTLATARLLARQRRPAQVLP